jgi:hypothetical protein
MCARRKQRDDEPVGGRAQLANGPLGRLFWHLLDTLDYWLTQAQLWLADAVCGPEPETDADQWRARDPRS